MAAALYGRPNAQHLDYYILLMGLRIDKVRKELVDAYEHAFLENIDNGKHWTHNYVDFHVEKDRATPYTKGHWDAVVWPFKWGFCIIGMQHVWIWLNTPL